MNSKMQVKNQTTNQIPQKKSPNNTPLSLNNDQLAILSQFLHNPNTKRPLTSEQAVIHTLQTFFNSQTNKEGIHFSANESPLVIAENAAEYGLFSDFFNVPFPPSPNPTFTFIDLFAGMGGFRLAMQAQGGKCVFSSEWNKYAQKTYFANFGEIPFGDITKESTKQYIPQYFDILCAGFPCQPFSIAGVSKKKSLGRETEIIKETLEELRYSIHYRVMDGQTYVPQHRERIMIVGFNKDVFHEQESFTFPEPKTTSCTIKDILDPNIPDKYTLSDKLWNYLQLYAEKHRAKGNGFGFGMADLNGISRTLSARYYKDGSEILIPQENGKNPRKLSPRECARLMGYPDNYRLNQVSDVQAYRQCGNSVVVPLITAVSKEIVKAIYNYEQQ